MLQCKSPVMAQADIQSPEIDFRLTPNIGHSKAHAGLPLLPSRPGEFHPEHRVAGGSCPPPDRVAGGSCPPPAPTERSVRISRTTLFGEGFTTQRMPGTADMAGPGVVAAAVALP